MPTTLSASDSFALSDSVQMQLQSGAARKVADNLLLSDSVAFLVGYLPSLSDTLSLSDRLQIQRSIALSLSDSLALADSGATPILAVQLILVLSDSLSLSDALSASASSGLDQYLRRYLNDVS